jgi:hypothetical protein
LSHHRRANKRVDPTAHYAANWDDDDAIKAGFDLHGVDLEETEKGTRPVRVFKCWKEPWEVQLHKKQDVKVKYKMLKKYGGMLWKDPDNDDRLLQADSNDMVFNDVRGPNRGWHVQALFLDSDGEEETETWECNHQLFGLIHEHYQENRDPTIFIETKPESFNEAGEWNFKKCGIALAAEAAAAEKEHSSDSGESSEESGEESVAAKTSSKSKSKSKSKKQAAAKRPAHHTGQSPRSKKKGRKGKK